CPAGAAQWFSDVYTEVSGHNLGGIYNTLLAVWGELERAFKYEKSGAKAPWNAKNANRPAVLEKWVKAGHGMWGTLGNGVAPPIGAIAVFDAAWWRWWGGVQPSWRVKDTGNAQRFLRGNYLDATVENWATLRHPGPNGALSFVATLYWWGMAVDLRA
ncbi:hypothetical protein B0H19DRAFT_898029, partial [Mycena capillaripes]